MPGLDPGIHQSSQKAFFEMDGLPGQARLDPGIHQSSQKAFFEMDGLPGQARQSQP